MKWNQTVGSFLTTACLWAGGVVAAADSYYKEPSLFSTAPSPEKSLQTIDRFGPVGMGIALHQPAFVMKIKNVEEGSPAAATGKLKAGQIIETINGQRLADIDPRIQLAQILAQAEATNGVMKFVVKDGVGAKTEEVIVKVPVLGAYSKTWPLNCPKSDKIVRDFADHLAEQDPVRDFNGIRNIAMLFLLSTGEEKDLEVVRKWARSAANRPHTYAWYLGYGGIPLCEYYLRTGDKEVLPGIQNWVDNAVKGQYLDGWAGRGGVCSVTYGNGHLNAGGTAVVTLLLLAKECGADVPDHALLGALVHFYRYSGRGGNPYGDHRPEVGFVDNGKNGNLAFAMAAAAALTPDGEESVYAGARDVCAMTSFYTTSFMLHGHTGGGIGEIWRSAAMGLLYEKKPKQYREFMDNRQWHYDLSRRFDGSFGILGGGGYDKDMWGVGYSLAYTIPRKTLRISGSPPSKYSKPCQLPKQPWGTEADNIFVTLEAVPDATGKRQDLSGETLAADSSRAFLVRLHGAGEVSDDLLRRYMHHQDHNIRFVAANKVLGINSGYIGWRSPGGEVRPKLVMEFLHSKSPRVRRAMFSAIYEIMRRERRFEILNKEIFDLAIQAIQAPVESWWVKDAALKIVGHAPADWVVPHVDLLLPYIEHEEWWLQNATLVALTPVVADERCYRKVLPAIGELVRTNQRSALTLGLMGSIRDKLKAGSPAVHRLATATLKETFTGYAGVKTAPGGQDISSTLDSHLEYIAASLADVPGGLDVLYDIGRQRFPQEILPYKQFFLNADPSQFGPKLKKAIKPIITEELIPEFVGRNRDVLRKLATVETQSGYPGSLRDQISQLAALYERAGRSEFGWHIFADLRQAEWAYHSFDPIVAEQVPWDQLITRYRDVTMPAGMENWYAADFDPAKAGWKKAKSPFGHYQGNIPQHPISKCTDACIGPGCFGAAKIHSFWEKEVLLLRGTFKIPPLKEGHRYRLRVNDGNHVGAGGGHLVYINGKKLIETKTCNGRGSGGQPKGAFITKDFLDDFQGGEVTIAVMTFLRFNDKYKVKPSERIPQGKINLHFEQMRLPPMGDDFLMKSANVVPMLTSAWQARQNPDDRELQTDGDKFLYDGRFVANRKVLGVWRTVDVVQAIDEFTPDKTMDPRRASIKGITFKQNGLTDSQTMLWTGDILMDIDRYQALKMVVKAIDGEDYLFVEAGGFSTRNPVGWKSPWYVMKRQTK